MEEKEIIKRMKELAHTKGNEIEEEVFDFLINDDFKNFVNETYIGGGSGNLKGIKSGEKERKACETLISKLPDSIFKVKKQRFLSIVGLSGSGKSESRKKLLKDAKYFPLDERLKIFLNKKDLLDLEVFKTNNKFDPKKFEYSMYCAAYLSGKYNNYIIDHSGGSPLQPGIQALAESLAGDHNFAIHLNVKSETIADNIMHTVMYDNEKSVKEPVRDEIGVKLGLVEKGFQKNDPARTKLVEKETDENEPLCKLRRKYQEFCKKNASIETTTKKLEVFREQLEEQIEYGEELRQIYQIHTVASRKYVDENEWRRESFNIFSPRTIVCNDIATAGRKMEEFLKQQDEFWAFIEGIPQRIPQYTNLSVLEADSGNKIFLFDMHGVMHSGEASGISQNVLDCLSKLKDSGKKVIIASNDVNSGEKYIETIKKKGLEKGKHFDTAITSGDVLNSMLAKKEIQKRIKNARNIQDDRKIKIFVLDELNTSNIFKGESKNEFEITSKIEEADAIITGSPRGEDGKRMEVSPENRQEYLAKRQHILDVARENKLPVIVPNPDRKTPFVRDDEKGGNYQTLGAGRFAKLYAQGEHGDIIMTGKPSDDFFNFVKTKCEELDAKTKCEEPENKITGNNILMIGDSFATDIVGANRAGIKTVAVVNARSNIGLTMQNKHSSFVERLEKEPKAEPNFVIGEPLF